MVFPHSFSRRKAFAVFAAAAWNRAWAQPAPGLINARESGAAGNGEANDTQALQKAIDAASLRGGATVYIPAGRYLCGRLMLKSGVSLWLDNGAVLAMSPDDSHFRPPENTESRATAGFRTALIHADDAESIAIYGQGTIDCNRPRGGGPKPVSLIRCRRVSLRGFTIRNAPSYNISLLGCDYVDIDGVTIQNGYSDGIDPDSCRFVRIANCFVESVDDAIVLKVTGTLADRLASEHVTVSNCVLRTASIHLKCGTESCGDFRNIVFAGCTLVGGMGMRHGNPGIALYTVDGGALRGIGVSNITMQDVGIPIALRRGNRDRCALHGPPGKFEDLMISNIVATGAKLPSVIAGLPDAPVEGVDISGLRIGMGRAGTGPAKLDEIPEKREAYPDPTMFGPLPAYGLWVRHAADLAIRDLTLRAPSGEQRPALVVEDARDITLTGLRGSPASWWNNVHASTIDAGPIRVSGSRTRSL